MLFLALRQLLSRKKQTILIFFGISLGTMMYIVIAGMQLGMQEFVIDKLLNNTSHIKISAREQVIDRAEMTQRFYGDDQLVDWITPPSGKREEAHIMYPQGWFDRLRADPEVLGYSPSLAMNVIISRGDTKFPGTLSGIIPAMHRKIMDVDQYITEGSLADLSGGGNKVIIGNLLLEKLGARVGNTIRVSSGLGELRPLKIVGVLSLGVGQVDEILMIGALRDVQALNKTPGRVNEIGVNLIDVEMAQQVADLWSLTSQDKVESWQQANANVLEVFAFMDIQRMAVTFAILLVAGFGIYNVLSIMINQKRREIAILRSIGYTPAQIMELFLMQGIMLGIAGASIGLILGHVVNHYLSTIELAFGPHGSTNHLLISRSPSIYFTGFSLAFGSSILASLLPAYSASKLTPIDIIRSAG